MCVGNFYWQKSNYIINRTYQFNINILKLRKIRSKTKFYKKIVKKTKTNAVYKTFKLFIPLVSFTLSPPLSTFLNLIGVNAQNFIDQLNKNTLNFLIPNTLIILTIFLRKDLSYNVNLNINYNSIVKSVFSNWMDTSNLHFLTFVKRRFKTYNQIIPIENEIFNTRVYTNLDLFSLTFFMYYLQSYIYDFNFNLNNTSIFLQLPTILEFESIINSIFGTMKSYNIIFLKTIFLSQKSKILLINN